MSKIKAILDFLEENYGEGIDNAPMRNFEIFKLLITTVLSQRTRDENTEKAVNSLFSVAKTPEEMIKLPVKKLQKLIKASGPYKQKAKRIKQISKIIVEKYKGRVPNNREELMKLPGVGFKTSAIVLMYGFNKPIIAIDTHCNRIPKRLGLVDKKVGVEEVRKKLESLFPKNKWYLINLGFVSFGREICKPINPRCFVCPFKSFCRAYKIKDFKV